MTNKPTNQCNFKTLHLTLKVRSGFMSVKITQNIWAMRIV